MLFSDIEGSTSLLKRLGPRWGEALSAQRRILRGTFEKFDGHEMGTEGDSFFIVFTSAHQAVDAAIEAQQLLGRHTWPDDLPIRVRMGLHTGEPERHEDGYIGIDVHRAARISATAHGGQIVISGATQALLKSNTVTTRDLGWHRLKDLPGSEHLFDIVAPGLLGEHPPLRSLGTKANLPAYGGELIGRAQDVASVSRLLRDGQRLVTLTGTAGTGKTRLAVAVACDLEGRLTHDIYFVPLHTADRAALMWSGIAEAIDAPGDAEQLPEERAIGFLSERETILILDNLEQIPDADIVVGRLLDRTHGVQVLATSRRPLHLVDEHQYPVAPLPVPRLHADVDVPELQTGAVDLFVRRARMVKPTFTLTAANAPQVIAVCRRLDGLPLAIELAAARSRLLSPKALLQRLDEYSDVASLAGRSSRQQTLRAAIQWSYDLLDPDDQRVLRHLGVFSGRFDLAAVAHVVGRADTDPLDIVAHLVDVSLLEIGEGHDGEPLLFLLQTIRQFARDLLTASPDHDRVRLAHARWCQTTATQISALLHTPRQMSALDRMQAVEEDIRAALDWCLADTDPTSERAQTGFALLEPMDTYWYRFGYIAEGRGWHERALRLLAHDVPDSPQVVDALHGEGVMAIQQMDLTTGARVLQRALAMAERLGDLDRQARESNSLGIAHRETGDVQSARRLIERSLAIARTIRDPHREATALTNVVHVHMDLGEYSEAVAAARRAIAADRALGDPWGMAINRNNLVMALLHSEGPQRAYEELRAVAGEAQAQADIELSIDVLENAAAIWAGLAHPRRAATLLGAADAQREIAGIPRAAQNQQYLDPFIEPARATVPADEWAAATEQGRGLDLDAAFAEAVTATSVPAST